MLVYPNADGTLNEDSQRYEGQYKDDKRHGHGYYVYPSGDRYFGEFSCDKPYGQGTYRWVDGNTYTGSWENGKMHG